MLFLPVMNLWQTIRHLLPYARPYRGLVMGPVLQKNRIFKGTIEEDIRSGLVDTSPEQVQQAARQAQPQEQIRLLPGRYQTAT